MTVLHVSGAQVWGGNEQQLIYLIDELNVQGVKQILFCYKDTPLYDAASKENIEIISSEPFGVYSNQYRKFLSSIVHTHDIDILHLHTSDAITGYVVTDIFKSLKTAALIARRGVRNKVGLLSKLKYNYKNIDGILCNSKYVKAHFSPVLSEKNKEKLVIVYSGLRIEDIPKSADYQVREKLNLSPETFLIGNIANHTNAKDLPTLVKVVDHLVNKLNFKDFHLVLFGVFSRNTEVLKEMIKEKNLESYITFMGFVSSASSFLPQFDVFLMTSEREGGPTTVIESLYHRIPVISTRVGVVDEVIEDGVNGFTAEVRDVEGLAERIIKFKNSPELAKQFTDLSYAIFEKKFIGGQLGKNTLAVYENLIRKHSGSKKKN